MRLFKPMTSEQLARNDRVLGAVLVIGGIFLAWDFFRSAQQGIPILGWIGYLIGPIFAHKVSEILLLIMWMPAVWVSNYEMSGQFPKRMSPVRYLHWLKRLLFFAPVQIILATYAWTIVNLGTSSLTTDFQPLIFGEDGWVWRYYLGAVTIAGAAFVPVAMRKIIKLVSKFPAKQE